MKHPCQTLKMQDMVLMRPNYACIWSWRFESKTGVLEFNWRRKRPAMKVAFVDGKGLVRCCSTSPANQVELDSGQESTSMEMEMEMEMEMNSASLSRVHGWHVRRMVEADGEMRKVARTQAEAFHEPSILFDNFFFEFFQAEVLAALLYRLKNSPPDRYACLVAEPLSDNESFSEDGGLVGVADVTVLRDKDVVRYLPGATEYLYVSGIAVLSKFRRQKVATALLKGCDALSTIWGFNYLVLRAFEDDTGARNLYSNAGYRVVSADPVWMSTWIGRRRRVLMIKQCDNA